MVVSLWRTPLTFVWPGVSKQSMTTAPPSRSECHLTVFCIDEIVPGYVVYLVNLYWQNYILSFYRSDNQIIAAGSAEGEVAIVNHQTGKIVANFSSKKRQSNSINEDEEENGNSSIESLIFSTPETNQLLTADVDGNFMGKIILILYKILVDFSSFHAEFWNWQ